MRSERAGRFGRKGGRCSGWVFFVAGEMELKCVAEDCFCLVWIVVEDHGHLEGLDGGPADEGVDGDVVAEGEAPQDFVAVFVI